ncbi:hypothetical protein C4573_04220 [Candidatus Woesearchaeota archaeon]|nr:MAG: hypothetical protein C4573_04220 [Candidatus Woesearchaeota archaeon]
MSYPIMHEFLRGLSRDVLDTTVQELIEKLMQDKFSFAVHQVAPGTSDNNYAAQEIGPIFGYNRTGLIPFFSDPTGEIKGGIILVEKKLIYCTRAAPLERQRDKFVWDYAHDHYYAPVDFKTVVQEFVDAGYTLHRSSEIAYDPQKLFLLKTEPIREMNVSELHA